MNELEAQSAFKQHATSKISTINDLFNISSLGFRGEALASIASISELSIHTYNGSDSPVLATENGTQTKITLGAGRALGTTVKASKIFHNVPARRKFLKSEATEYKYILETFINVVLARPRISFKLLRNDKQVLNLPIVADIWQRIIQLFPNLEKTNAVKLNYDDPQTQISGYLGHPITGSIRGNEQFLFVNGRNIKNPLINKAVKEGFGTALMRDINPTFFLFLQISNEIVDVNVHPRKLEVRFSDPGRMFATVKRAVSGALTKELKQELHANFLQDESKTAVPSLTKVTNSLNFSKEILLGSQKLSNEYKIPDIDFENQYKTLASIDIDKTITFTEKIPALTLQINEISQVFNTYLIFAQNNKLLFVDQHAAAERVNFERISASFASGELLNTQALLLPEISSISTQAALLINEHLELLNKIGFVVKVHNLQLEISSIPQILAGHDVLAPFNEILEDLKKSDANYSSIWREIQDKLIATLACHASIRAGQRLTPLESHKLILDLFNCKLPYSCPHGRPIIWELDRYQLEKNFKRVL
jgi:DNA mismatch repair protein MutL